ncbi:MAG TPA: pitrilysin family protein, partial [Gammaproteobacteria bacterium]|nr:pitrilysin family protein [Gammaproteobacteria bacterium]
PKSRLHPEMTTLSNGLRLIVEPESASHVVHVFGHVRGRAEVQVPTGKEGADSLLEHLLGFGTESMDRMAFQRALDDIGADASAGRDFSLTVLDDHLDRGLSLLADNELHPRLPARVFRVLRSQQARAVAGQLRSPDFHLRQQLLSAIYPKDDPMLRHATPDSVSGLTRKDLVDYYHKVYRPDLTTIVVVGDVSPDRVRKLVEKDFGDWRAKGPKPETQLPGVPLNRAHTVAVPDSSRSQDRVVLAETLGINRTDPGYYALNLGNQVLSGGFYTSRLYRILRAERGLVYSVSSGIDAHPTRSILEVSYGSDPDDVDEAHRVIARELKRMGNSPITAEELHQARAQLVRQVPLSESSVSDIGHGLIHRSAEGLPLDEPVQAAKRYLELTPEDVRQAYHRWVRPDDLVQVSEGPAPGQ